jgi:eukaryotic-like serine/threonine-protein kinase
MFQFITKRPFWVNLLAGLILMVILLFLLSILLGPLTRHGKNKTVPNVVGKTFEEARKILEKNGFDVIVQDSIYSDTIAKGSVLKQVPEGDAIVKISRTVYLTVNRYVPPVVEMPNLVDFSFRNAELQLKNMGLRVGDTSFVEDFAKNTVREQRYHKGERIPPGTKIPQGTLIDLVLANGVGTTEFTVPNLIGMTYGSAKTLLESNGLSFFSIMADPDVVDSTNAYISWQDPPRMGPDGKRIKIRSGQTMNVKLSVVRPVIDTTLTQNQIP